MKQRFSFALVGIAALSASIALAQSSMDDRPAPKPPAAQGDKDPAAGSQPALPPGITEADMQACMEAAAPGPMHEHLTEAVGVWHGKTTMWMTAEAEPMKSECTSTITSMMDGRFTKCEIEGEMPGMGPFNGFGIYGYDNVSEKFQSTWVDNCGTGMMSGTGDLSSDGKTLTWEFTYNCPMKKKPVVMREVERRTGPNTMTLEMFMPDPATDKEYKMMEIVFTRKPQGLGSAR